ncbi:MAG: Hsp20/alpha crystallin family protein [bacterium]|nr:Hsp20/alpha crystallin family protein [bacterium]
MIRPRRRGNVLVNWDPFAGLAGLGRLFDGCDAEACDTVARGFEVDLREDEGHYIIEAELPGVAADDVEVTLEDGVLTIAATRDREEQRDGENFHIRERHVGRFARSFRLPNDLDGEKVNAALNDGVLTVTLDKAEEAKPRKIAVQTN